MRDHHRRTIERLTALLRDDPAFPAVIVGGSLARGWERDDSDVDILLIATDEEHARRAATHNFQYFTRELCDYPDGYVDGKVVDLAFLREAAERGSEPIRAAFVGAWIAYSRLPELEALIRRIPVYPEHEQAERIGSFYAQLQAWQWYVGEAEKRGDRYLLTHVVGNVVLYGGRLILAHNKILFPYHKWLMTELRGAPDKPAGLMDQIERLLSEPTKRNADSLCETIFNFTQWATPTEGWPARFMIDTEWAWRRGLAPLADC